MIRVYNTLSKSKEPLEPVVAGKVGIYLCGPTVYKPSHIGHMVGPVIFDTVKRYLVYSGYEVTLVVNVTDVDDKLIAESQRRGISMSELAAEMTADYMNNLEALAVDTIDHFPRATDNIDEIIKFTATLIEKGFAYESDGDVYFEVSKAADYGKLSHRRSEAMQGDGGGTAERKRAGADFALWKGAKPGEPAWESPWGPGRPGWHIECSAMSRRLLGQTFDVHGGGLDLVFPHHENEIAQSESCHGKPMAKYWMHNGLMQASDEVGKVGGRHTRPAAGDLAAQEVGKISKSKGSEPFSELLEEFSGETIRFFVLSTQYRRPIDFGEARIREVETGLETFYRFFKRYERVTGKIFYEIVPPGERGRGEIDAGGDAVLEAVAEHRTRFLEAMDDDFNTGGAVGILFDLVRRLNKFVDDEKLEEPGNQVPAKLDVLKRGAAALCELSATLGLFQKPPEEKPAGDDELTGKQVLDYHGRLYGQSKTDRQAKIEELIALVDLQDAVDRQAKTYSGGMKRRLELARALMTKPEVLFLDEPTLGLDPQTRARIWDYIRALKEEQGITILMTTHYMDEAEKLADQVGIIDLGKLVAEGTPRELIEKMGADTIHVTGEGERDEFVAKVRALPSVQNVDVGRTVIQIGVDSGSRRLVEVVSQATSNGFLVEDISVAKPSLGDVFLKYTGRRLRDTDSLLAPKRMTLMV